MVPKGQSTESAAGTCPRDVTHPPTKFLGTRRFDEACRFANILEILTAGQAGLIVAGRRLDTYAIPAPRGQRPFPFCSSTTYDRNSIPWKACNRSATFNRLQECPPSCQVP